MKMRANQFWGVLLVAAGLVSLTIVPISAYLIIALAIIAMFAGGYIAFMHYIINDNEEEEKSNDDDG